MALKPYARHQHLVPSDVKSELRHARARAGSKYDGMKLLTLMERKDDVVELVERPVPLKNRKRKCSIIDQHDGRGRARTSENGKALLPLGNDRLHHLNNEENKQLIPFQTRAQPVKTYRGNIGGKLKGVVKEEYEANEKTEVKKENEKTYQGRGSRKNLGTRNYFLDVRQVRLGEKHAVRGQTQLTKAARGDSRLSTMKTAFSNCAVKKEPYHCVETRLPVKGVHSRTRNVKCAKCSFAYDSKRYLEGQGSSKTVPEVIILDSDKVVKKEISNPFVCSKKYYSSMDDEESQKVGVRSASDSEFRKELLKVLRKPFDKEELQKARMAFRAGSYLVYHPDVQRKLTKYRYKREKCLIILRGFLFWLQNLSHEGVFKPWKDKQCLELELRSR
ncbi:uncharacterized protein LOC131011818 isoform X2 [Salvia miltiorrhiza]|uniref:uncharacterized protein LOC131011818 isoform X2 n=1 Tax=Salvia miltiorrhiza TaxID=226208 RepID=UPI0025AB8BAE|nr:uncharacterized protein LOC131011818 isoform X2 [Salvia miltiorrhiza]XP_057795661.1 uncharacterized protein LOC131011818 isoform X2 [Salvia miltiorrhiza]XP_057795662.1 uncharacterized protein LOC131011818 isoform X2 [Salvia miltiorrhiza]XP_057795663.1 uncharacterized protein LOC131011818 isoform X2 [Salvia miltiorrhiza]XP_057795665.1 uncharacterized protein LOC131011818 isoform X2 [Salvia miltiorrhiza]